MTKSKYTRKVFTNVVMKLFLLHKALEKVVYHKWQNIGELANPNWLVGKILVNEPAWSLKSKIINFITWLIISTQFKYCMVKIVFLKHYSKKTSANPKLACILSCTSSSALLNEWEHPSCISLAKGYYHSTQAKVRRAPTINAPHILFWVQNLWFCSSSAALIIVQVSI